MARDRSAIGWQAVPEPELDTVALAHAVETGPQPAAGEMNRAVNRLPGGKPGGSYPGK